MKRELTRQQKTALAMLAVSLTVLLLLCVSRMAHGSRDSGASGTRTLQTIPDAENNESPESKTEAYRRDRSPIDSYWDALGEKDVDEAAPDEDRVAALSYETLFAPDEGARPRGRQQDAPPGRTVRDDPQRQAILEAIARQEQERRGGDDEAPAEEEPARMEGMQSQVRRTGGISSLDGGGVDPGSGFSSLDGPDHVDTGAGHPYRCMFVRDGKVKSGQRVSVRLLEDMVVGDVLIPRNTRLSAVCTIGRRMDVSITSIEINSRILAVGLEGYDNDGTKGIYCSDIVEGARQAKSQGLSTTGSILSRRSMTGVARDVASLGLAIAQSAGGETTVTIRSGYIFYLVQKNNQ